jgi:6-phosphogluconolactonase (cycloisomerase 2 family)
MRVKGSKGRIAIVTVIALVLCLSGGSAIQRIEQMKQAWTGSATAARLLSIAQIPQSGETCLMDEPSPDADSGFAASALFAAFKAQSVYAAQSGDTSRVVDISRPALRTIQDTDSIYTAVAVDTRSNEVFLQDNNKWAIRVFDRLESTPPNARLSEPKRVISGPKTQLQFNSAVYIDPKNGDLYSVENDTGDSIVVFNHDANGDVEPVRELHVAHRGFAVAVDEEKEEMFLSVNNPPQVAVYRKTASGEEKPVRVLRGEHTRLADAHGIAIDLENKLLFVNNWGSFTTEASVSGGRSDSASITIYALDAKGDSAPLRVIQGPRTQLNWPGTMALDPASGDLYVADDNGQSLLVFRGSTDNGDVAPTRVIAGNKTGLSYPVGLTIDSKNKELWAVNLGNSSATVYPLDANGNVAPLRRIRSAPSNKVSLRFGKTSTVAYDTKREQILVPN